MILSSIGVTAIPPPKISIGLLGKTNVGKSTFFSAATMISVEIENRPFVTLQPNTGVAYVRKKCVHDELGLPKCDARNSICLNGFRFMPVLLVDLPGLIKDAHKGRGLGNKFLDSIRQADVLIHVIDASGSTDEEGRFVKPGFRDPLEDVIEIEREYDEWMFSIISKDWPRFARTLDNMDFSEMVSSLTQRLSGLSIRREHVIQALRETKLESQKPSTWREEELRLFVRRLREVAKPIVVAANKIDVPTAEDNLKRLKQELRDRIIVPVTALGELILRKYAQKGVIKYLPGDQDFEVVVSISQKEAKGLELLRNIMKKYNGTGVQQAINAAVFDALKMIVVYPVEDADKFIDSKGAILPDAYLVPSGTKAIDLAYMVHTELGKGFLYAIDAKRKIRIGRDHILQDNDVISIVSAR